MRVTVDDETRSGRMIDAMICNGRFLGGGMMMCPDAEPDDGLFDVLLIGDVTKRDLAFVLPKTYKGKHLPHPRLELLRGSVVTVDADEPLPIELDGEQPGTTPARFEIVPRALRLRVSRRTPRQPACAAPGRRAGAFAFFSAASSFSSFATRASSASIPRTFFARSSTRVRRSLHRGERPLAAREIGEALQRLLAGVGEPCHEVLSPARLADVFVPVCRVVASACRRVIALRVGRREPQLVRRARPSQRRAA